jgi:hypothetical protein
MMRAQVLHTSGQTALSTTLADGMHNAAERAAALRRLKGAPATVVKQLAPKCEQVRRGDDSSAGRRVQGRDRSGQRLATSGAGRAAAGVP